VLRGFVDLGVGDYSIAIRGVLTAIGAQRKTLTQPAAADVRVWIDRQRMAAEFGDLLLGANRFTTRLTRVGRRRRLPVKCTGGNGALASCDVRSVGCMTDRSAIRRRGWHPWSRGGTQLLLRGPHVSGADHGQGAHCHGAASAVGAGGRQGCGEKCDVERVTDDPGPHQSWGTEQDGRPVPAFTMVGEVPGSSAFMRPRIAMFSSGESRRSVLGSDRYCAGDG
jgi:hypothetical protein